MCPLDRSPTRLPSKTAPFQFKKNFALIEVLGEIIGGATLAASPAPAASVPPPPPPPPPTTTGLSPEERQRDRKTRDDLRAALKELGFRQPVLTSAIERGNEAMTAARAQLEATERKIATSFEEAVAALGARQEAAIRSLREAFAREAERSTSSINEIRRALEDLEGARAIVVDALDSPAGEAPQSVLEKAQLRANESLTFRIPATTAPAIDETPNLLAFSRLPQAVSGLGVVEVQSRQIGRPVAAAAAAAPGERRRERPVDEERQKEKEQRRREREERAKAKQEGHDRKRDRGRSASPTVAASQITPPPAVGPELIGSVARVPIAAPAPTAPAAAAAPAGGEDSGSDDEKEEVTSSHRGRRRNPEERGSRKGSRRSATDGEQRPYKPQHMKH